jgi:hypothetical protein
MTEAGNDAVETQAEIKARKEREKDELYALDISGVEWHSAPGTEQHEERVEIAYLPDGAVAMCSSLGAGTALRDTEAEWRAFVLGERDGEFDQRWCGGGVVRGRTRLFCTADRPDSPRSSTMGTWCTRRSRRSRTPPAGLSPLRPAAAGSVSDQYSQ